jgi:hypothetical protein
MLDTWYDDVLIVSHHGILNELSDQHIHMYFLFQNLFD